MNTQWARESVMDETSGLSLFIQQCVQRCCLASCCLASALSCTVFSYPLGTHNKHSINCQCDIHASFDAECMMCLSEYILIGWPILQLSLFCDFTIKSILCVCMLQWIRFFSDTSIAWIQTMSLSSVFVYRSMYQPGSIGHYRGSTASGIWYPHKY